jgi:hypothetical protein
MKCEVSFRVWLVHAILPDTLVEIINNVIILIFHISHECKQWWWQKVVTYFAFAFFFYFFNSILCMHIVDKCYDCGSEIV